MWRPEGWECYADVFGIRIPEGVRLKPYERESAFTSLKLAKDSFEAGADAMLEALRDRMNFFISENDEDTVEDGFGSTWGAYCPECGFKTMCVVRPGKVQCNFCIGGDTFIPDET